MINVGDRGTVLIFGQLYYVFVAAIAGSQLLVESHRGVYVRVWINRSQFIPD